jgi:hypothetical protein
MRGSLRQGRGPAPIPAAVRRGAARSAARKGAAMAREWEWLLLRKFPALDVRWSSAVQARWWQSFDRLMALVAQQAALPKPGAA